MVVSYARESNFVIHPYAFNGVILEDSTVAKGLGIVFDQRFIVDEHIKNMVCKAFKSYGFIYRKWRDFIMLTLFFALVRVMAV